MADNDPTAQGNEPNTQTPAASSSTEPPTPPAAAGDQGEPKEQSVPYARFREVVADRDRLAKAQAERDEAAAKEQGKWQELAEKRDADLKTAAERFLNMGRRSAFIAAAAGKVTDAAAAYVLARDAGLLSDVKITDDGDPDDPKALDEAVKKVLAQFPFLKVGDSSFGQQRGGQPAAPSRDPAKMTSTELMSEGYAAHGSSTQRR